MDRILFRVTKIDRFHFEFLKFLSFSQKHARLRKARSPPSLFSPSPPSLSSHSEGDIHRSSVEEGMTVVRDESFSGMDESMVEEKDREKEEKEKEEKEESEMANLVQGISSPLRFF